MSPPRAICVYAASSPGVSDAYTEAAVALGTHLAEQSVHLVYGGGRAGLMGALADAALAAGGEVTGIIPAFLDDRELTHRGVTHLHVTASMHERKQLMADLSDGFIALPGGIGTLEELVEVLTWAQLQIVTKPITLLDVGTFWDPFVALLSHLDEQGFMREGTRGMLRRAATPAAALAAAGRPAEAA